MIRNLHFYKLEVAEAMEEEEEEVEEVADHGITVEADHNVNSVVKLVTQCGNVTTDLIRIFRIQIVWLHLDHLHLLPHSTIPELTLQHHPQSQTMLGIQILVLHIT